MEDSKLAKLLFDDDFKRKVAAVEFLTKIKASAPIKDILTQYAPEIGFAGGAALLGGGYQYFRSRHAEGEPSADQILSKRMIQDADEAKMEAKMRGKSLSFAAGTKDAIVRGAASLADNFAAHPIKGAISTAISAAPIGLRLLKHTRD